MLTIPQSFLALLPKLNFTAIVDILIVAILIYQFVVIVRGRRAAHILSGMGVVLLVYLVARWARLELLRSILAALAPYTVFALIVLFQAEIRRVLAKLGRRRWPWFLGSSQAKGISDEITMAVQQLAGRKIGALIVLERDIGLRTFIESGVLLDSHVSRDLLLAIFEPKAALHDGAVIVQGERIAAAACFLPLSINPNVVRKLGTRHRAAIGVTEETDCLAIVASEETGRISAAAFGEIETDLTPERLAERVARHFGRKGRAPVAPAPLPQVENEVPLPAEGEKLEIPK
jgi:diadenylate cyclase